MEYYNTIVLGGTFDHFHLGHEAFLQFALDRCDRLIVGLTSDSFSHQKNDTIETYKTRLDHLQTFFTTKQAANRVHIVPIDDLYGPTLTDAAIDAIVVSPQTRRGAEIINQKRQEQGLPQLTILETPLIQAMDQQPVSSSRIRSGSIDRNGKTFVDPSWRRNVLEITPPIRKELAKPFGEFIADFDAWVPSAHLRSEHVVTVGDVVTKAGNRLGINQRFSVVDFRVEREDTYQDKKELGFGGDEMVFTVINPPGTIMPSLWNTIERIKEQEGQRVIIKIDGEEDLAVLPLVLSLPLGFIILYGQPHEGVVTVPVNEAYKEKAQRILSAFHLSSETTRGH